MGRNGRQFELGYPHFYNGIDYTWPDKGREFDALFLEKRDELRELLLKRFKQYIQDFHLYAPCPHVSKGMRGLSVVFGDGGREIELWKMIGDYFIAGHNLDGWKERAAAMNIGSDVLEHLDSTILAPRVAVEQGIYLLKYPIPKRQKFIAQHLVTEDRLSSACELIGLEGVIKVTQDEKSQRIESPQGVIIIENRMCEGRGFKGWDIPKASWLIASIMGLYDKNS